MRRVMLLTALLGWLLAGGSGVRAQVSVPLEGPEQQAMTDTVQYALEKNPTNQGSDWVNPDTGRSGAVVPVRTFENTEGQPCREFITTIIIGGKEEQGYGTACREPDGSWKIVADDRQSPPAAPPPQPTPVYVYPPPPVYYSYPPEFYGPGHIFLSFSYVYRSGRMYRGSYYLDGPDFRRRYPFPVRERVFVGPRVFEHYRWREGWERRGSEEHRYRDGRPDRDDRRSGEGRRGGEVRRGGEGRPDQRWGDPDRPREDRNRGRP